MENNNFTKISSKAPSDEMLFEISKNAEAVVNELLERAKIKVGDIVVVGCSTSEVAGNRIGTFSGIEIGERLFKTIHDILSKRDIFIAAQCCEHLNRALILEKECALKYGLEIVNAVPQLNAGGAFSTAAYKLLEEPVAVEGLKCSAAAGIDIGDTLIGMHLKQVAVPVRTDTDMIGMARVVCARTRPKYIGGQRAIYDEELA